MKKIYNCLRLAGYGRVRAFFMSFYIIVWEAMNPEQSYLDELKKQTKILIDGDKE